ncbi:MAG: AAA family ATPase, partial [Stackebrandtia sp.]
MRVVGRDDLLRLATDALAWSRSVLLHGPPGIGKSSLIDILSQRMRADGVRVLRAAPAQVEKDLPHLVLVDLLADALAEKPDLPDQLRDALAAVVWRSRGDTRPSDELTVRVAALELLRRVAEDGPVLLVVDDAQWVDDASAEVLAFAARRLGDAPVRLLAGERVDEGEPRTARLCPDPVTSLEVEPLGLDEITTLLEDRLDTPLSARMVQRVFVVSGGNAMYALELGRVLGKSGADPAAHEPLPVPERLRGLLAGRLDGLDADTRRALLLASLAPRLTLDGLAACDVLPQDGLSAAEKARVVSVDADGAVVFQHPLLRELVSAEVTTAQRREAHAALAEVTEEPVARARHLALGSAVADEQIAAEAEKAAADAANRGAPGVAADLARL